MFTAQAQPATPSASAGPEPPTILVPYEDAPDAAVLLALGAHYLRNSSGTHSDVPGAVGNGWNWGAAGLPYLWLWQHELRNAARLVLVLDIAALVLAPTRGAAAAGLMVAWLATRAAFLGTRGNRLAWRNRCFESVAQFHSCQRAWQRAGLLWFIAFCVWLVTVLARATGAT